MGSAWIDLCRNYGDREEKLISEQKAKDKRRSWIRLMHDDKYLYVGWLILAAPEPRKAVMRDVFPPGSARTMIFGSAPDTPEDEQFTLVFDDSGNQFDARGMNERAWDSGWQVRTGQKNGCAAALVRIPKKDLPVRNGEIFAMFRNDGFLRSWFGEKTGRECRLHPLRLSENVILHQNREGK